MVLQLILIFARNLIYGYAWSQIKKKKGGNIICHSIWATFYVGIFFIDRNKVSFRMELDHYWIFNGSPERPIKFFDYVFQSFLSLL